MKTNNQNQNKGTFGGEHCFYCKEETIGQTCYRIYVECAHLFNPQMLKSKNLKEDNEENRSAALGGISLGLNNDSYKATCYKYKQL